MSLRFKIFAVHIGWRDIDRLTRFNFYAGSSQLGNLFRITREQADARDAESCQHGSRALVVTCVGRKAKTLIGGKGVQPLILQCVGFDLCAQANATPLLVQVHQHASVPREVRKCRIELRPAIAAGRAEQVTGQARGMHPYPRHRCERTAKDQRKVIRSRQAVERHQIWRRPPCPTDGQRDAPTNDNSRRRCSRGTLGIFGHGGQTRHQLQG